MKTVLMILFVCLFAFPAQAQLPNQPVEELPTYVVKYPIATAEVNVRKKFDGMLTGEFHVMPGLELARVFRDKNEKEIASVGLALFFDIDKVNDRQKFDVVPALMFDVLDIGGIGINITSGKKPRFLLCFNVPF